MNKANPLSFSGKRIRQNSAKLKQIKKRDKRLRKIGLSVMDFVHGFDYVTYLKGREDGRIAARKAKEEAEKVNKPKRRGRPRKIKPEQTAQTAESL